MPPVVQPPPWKNRIVPRGVTEGSSVLALPEIPSALPLDVLSLMSILGRTLGNTAGRIADIAEATGVPLAEDSSRASGRGAP